MSRTQPVCPAKTLLGMYVEALFFLLSAVLNFVAFASAALSSAMPFDNSALLCVNDMIVDLES